VQKNLVYVVGLSPHIPEQDLLQTLRGDKYFGQYGKIIKIVVSKAKQGEAPVNNNNPSLGVYVTFARKEDASKCIAAVNGSQNGDRILRAQLGTTKYCSAYLRNEICTNKSCMFLHEPGDNDDSYSRQDLSSINSVSTQRPLPPVAASSSRQIAQAQAPIQQAQPIAAAAQPMAREPSKDESDNGDSSALPSSASWANRGGQQFSRRGSLATSGAASSPAISTALPATTTEETDEEEEHGEQIEEETPEPVEPAPASPPPRKAKMDPILADILRSISYLTTISADLKSSQEGNTARTPCLPFFDDFGGLKRRAIREQQEAARLHMEQELEEELRSVPEPQEEQEPESGSLQLGGEPEDREDHRDVNHASQNFHDQRRLSTQLPIQRVSNEGALFSGGLGQNFGQSINNLASINGRALTPMQQQQILLLKSGQPQSGFMDQFPPGIGGLGSQSGLFQQGHNRQSSRYNFATDSSAGTLSAKPAATNKLLGQQASLMGPQGNQFYGSAMPGPPPGLKSTGTPPINGNGMFGQSHFGGSSFGGPGKENSSDVLRDLLRGRGGMGAGSAGSAGQSHDVGKREFMFPSFLHQYPSTSTPAPAPGLLASLYGSQPGAFQDFGPKQKKKGKKHRHANTSSSGGGGLVDLADPNILQVRMPHQQQSNAGGGQGLFGGQTPGGYNQNMMYGAYGGRW
jgi:CCR4-NOT transcription complex subunit 4